MISKYYFDNFIYNFLERENNRMQCDIYVKDDKYYIEMDLAGFKREEIKVECNNWNIAISAEKENNNDDDSLNKKYIRRERLYNKYTRSFYLGDINEDTIEAQFIDGTLKIIISKSDEKDTKKYIDIK